MTKLDEILNSKEFNKFFDIKKEKKELLKYGWTYKDIQRMADMIIYLQNFQNQ